MSWQHHCKEMSRSHVATPLSFLFLSLLFSVYFCCQLRLAAGMWPASPALSYFIISIWWQQLTITGPLPRSCTSDESSVPLGGSRLLGTATWPPPAVSIFSLSFSSFLHIFFFHFPHPTGRATRRARKNRAALRRRCSSVQSVANPLFCAGV